MYPYFPYVPYSAFRSFRPNRPVGGTPFGPPIPLFPPMVPLPPKPMRFYPISIGPAFPNPHAAYWRAVNAGIFDPTKLTIIQAPPAPCPALKTDSTVGPVDIIDSTEGYTRKARHCYYDRSRKVLVYCPTTDAKDDVVLTHPVADHICTQDRTNDRNFITQEGLLHYVADLELSSRWKTVYLVGVKNTQVVVTPVMRDNYSYDFPNGLLPFAEDEQAAIAAFKEAYGAFHLDRFPECPMWDQILTDAKEAVESGNPFYIPFDAKDTVSVLSVESVEERRFTARYGNDILVFTDGEYEAHPYTTKIALSWDGPEDSEFYHWMKTVAVVHDNRFPNDVDDGADVYNPDETMDARDVSSDHPVVLTNIDQTRKFYIRVFTVNDMDLTDLINPWELIVENGVVVSDNRRES